jgi:hypothetical protein
MSQLAPRHNPFANDPLTLHINVFHQEADVEARWCMSCGARLHDLPEYVTMMETVEHEVGVPLGVLAGPSGYHSPDNAEHLEVSPLDLIWQENQATVRRLELEAQEAAARANWTKSLW